MHWSVLPDTRASEDPSAPCLAGNGTELANEDFLLRVRRACAALRDRGVGAGDVVALMMPNRIEFVVAMFAAWRLGATVTPINPELTVGEAEYQASDSGAALVVTDSTELSCPVMEIAALDAADMATVDDEPQAVPCDDGSLALLVYTSGTTGKPKGVILDHANLTAMCEMALDGLHLDENDHSLLILPLFHVNGIVVSILSPLLAGARATIAGGFSPQTFLDTVQRVRPTYFSAVPAIYAMLSALPSDTDPDLASLRFAICGAAPMPAELIDRFELRFGVPVVEGYGLSEGTCASTINPVDGIRKPGTVGLPLPGQRVTVVDRTGAALPDGQAGEVVISGPNVMRGYLNRPEATAETIVDGWLHTGDVGYLDEDGYLVLVDRIKDMIIRGGENIYPKEIESILYTHEGVLEAAVVGRAHDVLGEVPVAFVVPRPEAELDEAELDELCRKSLSRYKVPEETVITESLPKNPVGKIDKPALRTR